ncbi:high affinity copper uptake protein 1 [Octopus sinensis]|uniref:Copper transport protein n=1 Tax=Octopus sinensis TaxID=2607531 RepID=A0A6P7SNK2_9MOLL|nr:high affinity copper uptake protein 1 [Octopus sinensis]XP_029639845.1 high affinity copper uptake protein 1 [Octopus sinensis]XP_036361234.1 high affinity copper uptake protein 1 [Octopus sinensis]
MWRQSPDMMHSAVFNTNNNISLLVSIWKIHSLKALTFSCIIIGVLALLHQGIKFLLIYTEAEDIHKHLTEGSRGRIFTKRRILQTLLHMIKVANGYILMLVVMTFNTWIFVTVVCGLTVGYFCYGWSIQDNSSNRPISKTKSKSKSKNRANAKTNKDRGQTNGQTNNPPHLLSRNVLYPGEHISHFITLLDQDLDVTEV